MSAIGGLLRFDRAPVNRRLLRALGMGLTRLGPDGGDELVHRSIGFAYRAFHTNVESRRERQPLVRPGPHVLTWDGRLDNRQELLRELRDECGSDMSDAGIVMASYLRWTDACFER